MKHERIATAIHPLACGCGACRAPRLASAGDPLLDVATGAALGLIAAAILMAIRFAPAIAAAWEALL